MLFTFLLGLGAGAEAARHLLRTSQPLIRLLGWLEFGLAIVILGGVFMWDTMPDYFASFATYPLARGFAAREVIRGIVCWLAMFPPAFFIGAIYPVAMECIGRAHAGHVIPALGRAAALNTLGNIVGVLAGGFLLLPMLGALRTVHAPRAGLDGARGRRVVGVAAGAALGDLGPRRSGTCTARGSAGVLRLRPPRVGRQRLLRDAEFGRVIDHAENIDGGLTSSAQSERPGLPPLRTLLTNGKFQGNDAQEGEMQAQFGFSLAPLLHTSHRKALLSSGMARA